jgi:hypothetical protein
MSFPGSNFLALGDGRLEEDPPRQAAMDAGFGK